MDRTDAQIEDLLNRPALTDAERANVNEYVARHGGSHAAALDIKDPALAAEVDALFARTSAGAR